jgi:dephospho-CoA kinase
MIVVGLTGGVGSGKTTIAKQFNALGIPVYIADDEAKKLMHTSKIIKRKLFQLFGENAYVNGELNKPFIAKVIFNDKRYLELMNAIVHPKVAKHFSRWLTKQKSPYVIKESAILFESGSYKQCDLIILVTAPKALKIKRLLQRDNTTKDKIKAIMNNQLPDAETKKRSDYIIVNDTLENAKVQVDKIHSQIVKILQ